MGFEGGRRRGNGLNVVTSRPARLASLARGRAGGSSAGLESAAGPAMSGGSGRKPGKLPGPRQFERRVA